MTKNTLHTISVVLISGKLFDEFKWLHMDFTIIQTLKKAWSCVDLSSWWIHGAAIVPIVYLNLVFGLLQWSATVCKAFLKRNKVMVLLVAICI